LNRSIQPEKTSSRHQNRSKGDQESIKIKAKGKRQKAKGKRQKAKGKRQKAKGKGVARGQGSVWAAEMEGVLLRIVI